LVKALVIRARLGHCVLAVAASGLAAAGCTEDRARDPVFSVPLSITADCSRTVETELAEFLATVPDGATVRFPPGRCYGQDRTIVLRDRHRLIIDGNGSTFRRLTPPNSYDPPSPNLGNANWRVIRGAGVTLRNMTIRGNYVPPPRGKAPGQGQHTDQGISLWGAVDVTIVDVSIFNTDGEFVEADPDVEEARAKHGGDYAKVAPSRNIRVSNLHGEHAGRQCVATTAVDGFWLENSYLADCQQNGFDGEIDTQGELNRNIHLVGNTFDGIYFSAISIPVLSLPGFEGQVGAIELRANTVTQAGDTCYPAILVGADERGTVKGVTISENTLLTQGDGIQFGGAPGGVQASVTKNTIRKTVANAGCDNPNFTPPYSTPVRANGGSVHIADNLVSGFCCQQDRGP
jgi:hypothetical protein